MKAITNILDLVAWFGPSILVVSIWDQNPSTPIVAVAGFCAVVGMFKMLRKLSDSDDKE